MVVPATPAEALTAWRKPRRSVNNGACVEVADLPGGLVGVRDSKNPSGPVLSFSTSEWRRFLADVKSGRLG